MPPADLESYLDAYLAATGIGDQKRSPLFRAIDRHRQITERPIAGRMCSG